MFDIAKRHYDATETHDLDDSYRQQSGLVGDVPRILINTGEDRIIMSVPKRRSGLCLFCSDLQGGSNTMNPRGFEKVSCFDGGSLLR